MATVGRWIGLSALIFAFGALLASCGTSGYQGPNEPPTDVLLSSSSVMENMPAGTFVGNLSTVDPDSGDTHSYTVIGGDGMFHAVADRLETTERLASVVQATYSLSVRSRDRADETVTSDFTIEVLAAPNTQSLVIPTKKVGTVAHVGQAGSEIRSRTPDRTLAFDPYVAYSFFDEDYRVTVCSATDRVHSLSVGRNHASSGQIETAEGIGFASSRDTVLAEYGAPDDSLVFNDLELLIYEEPGGSMTFEYRLSDLSHVESISVQGKPCT